ncbi:MAG TPA: NfeD family protein [Candidatus Micrarchaeaceae archaeon]|nr:NfeD family protein [Candidatus Micrarchaeaceae archaeon]
MRRRPIVGAVLVAASGFFGSQLPVLAAASSGQAVSRTSGFLGFVANPTVAFVLLLVALLGIGLETIHRGTFVFGAVGLLAGGLAAVGLANQPVEWVGLVIVALAATLLVVDTSLHSHGLVSIAGVGLAVVGGLLLYRSSPGESGVSLVALITVPVVLSGTWITLSRRALRVRHLPYASSSHELLGLIAVVRERADPIGIAAVEGELWRIAARREEPIEVGAKVEVMAQDGLTLIVEPLPGPATASEQLGELGVGAGTGIG